MNLPKVILHDPHQQAVKLTADDLLLTYVDCDVIVAMTASKLNALLQQSLQTAGFANKKLSTHSFWKGGATRNSVELALPTEVVKAQGI